MGEKKRRNMNEKNERTVGCGVAHLQDELQDERPPPSPFEKWGEKRRKIHENNER
jgi:hypothetical protein